MKKYSNDYHDYVIRDGVLVGKFEEMYKYSSEIPWRQDRQESWIDVRLTTEMIQNEDSFDTIIDYGCGLGHYLDLLCRKLHITSGYGFDISRTAIERAQNNFPAHKFKCEDLMKNSKSLKINHNGKALHVIRGTLWYVFPKIEIVVKNLISCLSEKDVLLVIQNFPRLDSNFVGKEVFPDYHAIAKEFTKDSRLRLNSMIWYEKELENKNDSWFIGSFELKKS